MQIQIPQVDASSAKQFAEAWNRARPVSVIFDQHDLAFAADFANTVVQQIFAGILAQQEAEKKKLVIAES
jgi:hypothetical protein